MTVVFAEGKNVVLIVKDWELESFLYLGGLK